MFSLIGSNIIFNIIEYFSFINLFLLFLFIIITLFFIFIYSSLLFYSNVNFNHCLIEFISTLFSLLFLIIIISPALIILLDFDLIILPSFIIYSLGLQWAWQFNIIFISINIGFNSYCDHYIISTNQTNIIPTNYSWGINIDWFLTNRHIISRYLINIRLIDNYLFIGFLFNIHDNIEEMVFDKYNKDNIEDKIIKLPFYLWDCNSYILIPLFSYIRLFIYSFDVIHTLGFYSWGIKIDAIPGRINLATTLRLLWKGEYRGKCFELCGQGHLSMMMLSNVL